MKWGTTKCKAHLSKLHCSEGKEYIYSKAKQELTTLVLIQVACWMWESIKCWSNEDITYPGGCVHSTLLVQVSKLLQWAMKVLYNYLWGCTGRVLLIGVSKLLKQWSYHVPWGVPEQHPACMHQQTIPIGNEVIGLPWEWEYHKVPPMGQCPCPWHYPLSGCHGVVARSSVFIRVRVGGHPRATQVFIWSVIDQWGGDSWYEGITAEIHRRQFFNITFRFCSKDHLSCWWIIYFECIAFNSVHTCRFAHGQCSLASQTHFQNLGQQALHVLLVQY